MKNHIFLGGLLILFLIEFVALSLFTLSKEEISQDTVAVNEIVKTLQNDWDSLEKHKNHTSLSYVVLDLDGAVLYRTTARLSESINAAISHKDTILDIKIDGQLAGKLIVYNNDALAFQHRHRLTILTILTIMLLQGCICTSYFFYIRHVMIKPFEKMKDFAERIADGNLDIPLKMDRQNLFGAFTESFDIMRTELKKSRIAEANANESKKELVAKLSHDIKTPIASIKAASEVGAALSPDKKNRETYEQIIQKANQINTLITNLFSATLEELHELSVTPSALKSEELSALLENADYLHRAAMPSIPDCVLFADKLRLQQVLDNLFANSYKYANTNIHVTAHMTDNYFTISIEDYGKGVDRQELPLLKEKFKRGSNTKNIEGAGLGLYISDYCMNKMLGRLDIENGTTGLKATVWIALHRTI